MFSDILKIFLIAGWVITVGILMLVLAAVISVSHMNF